MVNAITRPGEARTKHDAALDHRVRAFMPRSGAQTRNSWNPSDVAKKYQPVVEYLRALADSGETRVEMLFGQLDRMVGGLPTSARKNRTWWANNSLSQAQAWRSAGWHVAAVDLAQSRVTFEVGEVGGSYAIRKQSERAGAPRVPMRSTHQALVPEDLPELDTVAAKIVFCWRDAGEVRLESGKLLFPPLPDAPGLYRMALASASVERVRWYIGESDNLKRRSGNYRNPGNSQRTSTRINALLLEHLQDGGSVHLSIAVDPTVDIGGSSFRLDMTRKASRLLAENAALVVAHDGSTVDIENLG